MRISFVVLALMILACMPIAIDKQPVGNVSVDRLIPWRGLLALTIVTDHLSQELSNPGILSGFSWTGYIVVSIFLGISGFGLATQMIRTNGYYIDSFLQKRLPKILVPFWLSNIVYIVVSSLIYHDGTSFAMVLCHFLGLRLINSNAWYVVALLVLYALFYLSSKLVKKQDYKKQIFLMIAGSVVYSIFCLLIVKKYWWMNAILGFIVGFYYAYNRNIVEKSSKEARLKVGVAVIAFGACFWSSWHFPVMPIGLFAMMVASVIIVPLFLILVSHFSLEGKVIRWLGEISYELYLIHNCFRHMFKDILVINNDIVYYFAVLFCSIFVAWVLSCGSKALLGLSKK